MNPNHRCLPMQLGELFAGVKIGANWGHGYDHLAARSCSRSNSVAGTTGQVREEPGTSANNSGATPHLHLVPPITRIKVNGYSPIIGIAGASVRNRGQRGATT